MRFSKIMQMFRDGNVCVTGLRGSGKDMLFANVIIRRKLPYVSNTNYGGDYRPFRYRDIDCGGNSYKNFISGCLNYYEYPYSDGTDVYLADAGVYFPSQYCSELNKLYPQMPVFQALSRHLGDCNFHVNVQNLNRCWDKIREQSDQYIYCLSCKVIFGIVFQRVRIYERYSSCVDRVPPCRVALALFGKRRTETRIYRDKFESSYGVIKERILIYRNRSSYNTRIFRDLMTGRS